MGIPGYRFLDRPAAVESLFASLAGEPALAIDLEADSLHSYREKVCLLQVSTRDATAIVDPLRCREALRALGPILANPSIQKVLHGGDYDVRLLKKDFAFEFRNLFDTMIAAQFTGREQFGLAALLLERFGVALDKKYQRADWSARPLQPALLDYAALDTAYLLELKAGLEEELVGLGRLAWVEEEFRLLETVEPSPVKPPWCLDVKGASRLAPRALAVLQELLETRDRAAQAWDRPPFKVLPNQLLLDWAQNPPATRKDVVSAQGAGTSLLARLADEILEGVRRARTLPLDQCPRPNVSPHVPLTGVQERRLKRLKKARTDLAEALRLPPGLLVNSATLEKLCRMEPDEANGWLCSGLKRWQLEVAGEDLRRALAGQAES